MRCIQPNFITIYLRFFSFQYLFKKHPEDIYHIVQGISCKLNIIMFNIKRFLYLIIKPESMICQVNLKTPSWMLTHHLESIIGSRWIFLWDLWKVVHILRWYWAWLRLAWVALSVCRSIYSTSVHPSSLAKMLCIPNPSYKTSVW